MSVKSLLKLVSVLLVLGIAQNAGAQAYPTKAIRVIIAFPPGGSLDVVGRILFDQMTPLMGQNLVIDYRPGASGNIGTELAARAAPDGYTLTFNTLPLVVNPSMYRKLPYDPVRDFAPISLVGAAPFVLVVHPSLPVKSVKELIALAKSHPGKLNYSSAGIGTNLHVAVELLKNLTRTNIAHIPYKGGGPALTSTLSGETQLSVLSIPAALPHIQTNRFRAIATTGPQRSPALPKVPTVAEGGVPGYEFTTWWGLLAPAGTPPAIVNTLREYVVKAAKTPQVSKRFTDEGIETIVSTPEEFAAHIKMEVERWARVVKENNIEPQ